MLGMARYKKQRVTDMCVEDVLNSARTVSKWADYWVDDCGEKMEQPWTAAERRQLMRDPPRKSMFAHEIPLTSLPVDETKNSDILKLLQLVRLARLDASLSSPFERSRSHAEHDAFVKPNLKLTPSCQAPAILHEGRS
jgi:hypothetical protein